jgi:chromosome segregation ATPase
MTTRGRAKAVPASDDDWITNICEDLSVSVQSSFSEDDSERFTGLIKRVRKAATQYQAEQQDQSSNDFWQIWSVLESEIRGSLDENSDTIINTCSTLASHLTSAISALPRSFQSRLPDFSLQLDLPESDIRSFLSQYELLQQDLTSQPNSRSVTRLLSHLTKHLTDLLQLSAANAALETARAQFELQIPQTAPNRKALDKARANCARLTAERADLVKTRKQQRQQISALETGDLEELQAELDSLNAKFEQLSRDMSQFQEQPAVDSLFELREQRRLLEEESVRLDIFLSDFVSRIEDRDRSSTYRENAALQGRSRRLNMEFLRLRERCLRMNSVWQKARLSPQNSDFEGSRAALQEEYDSILAENRKRWARRDKLAKRLEEITASREESLREMFGGQLPIGLLEQLRGLQGECQGRKVEVLGQQERRFRESAAALKRRTDAEMAKLRQQTRDRLAQAQSRADRLTSQIEKLERAVSKARSGGASEFAVDKTRFTAKTAAAQLQSLGEQLEAELRPIREANVREIQQEVALMEEEIGELGRQNAEIPKYIADVQQETVEQQAELRTLVRKDELMRKRLDEPDFDLDEAFTEELDRMERGNTKLTKLLAEVTNELTELDVQLGGTRAEMPLRERLVSITAKIEQRRTKR